MNHGVADEGLLQTEGAPGFQTTVAGIVMAKLSVMSKPTSAISAAIAADTGQDVMPSCDGSGTCAPGRWTRRDPQWATHNRVESPAVVNETLLIQSGCHGSFVGRLDLQVEGSRITGYDHHLTPVDDSMTPDPAMQALVDIAMTTTRPLQEQIVGQTQNALHRATSLNDVLLAAIARTAGTDIAFSNGWRYGAPVPPGPVTLNDLWNIVPTNPPVSVVDLTGAEIVTLLEANLESTFSADSFGQRGGFVKRFRGLTANAKLENPRGHRLEQVFTRTEKIDPEATYPVAFITAQGVPPPWAPIGAI